ncbi:MAG: polysaccharide biosynthesis C-terminal domain-containing protein, partial [Actinobacteria bacterium]|nr:polysaccharide biosynthesis C-terminal domain-containing protein [Actinomycetota bacterium]
FGYGRFTTTDAALVAALLALYAASIPAWGLHQIMARHFYARRRMWMPVGIGTVYTLVAVPVWLVFRDRWGVEGMAAASTVVMVVYALTMLYAWRSDTGRSQIGAVARSMTRALVAASVAAVAGRFVVDLMADGGFSTAAAALAVAAGGAVTIGVYLLATLAMRSQEWAEMRRGVRDE